MEYVDPGFKAGWGWKTVSLSRDTKLHKTSGRMPKRISTLVGSITWLNEMRTGAVIGTSSAFAAGETVTMRTPVEPKTTMAAAKAATTAMNAGQKNHRTL
jgi:hypothetical protein